jgi:hypothetical protein
MLFQRGEMKSPMGKKQLIKSNNTRFSDTGRTSGTQAIDIILANFANPVADDRAPRRLKTDAISECADNAILPSKPKNIEKARLGIVPDNPPEKAGEAEHQRIDDSAACAPTRCPRQTRLVAYRGGDGKLHGGYDDPQHGTVRSRQYGSSGQTFTLTDGAVISAKSVVSVGNVDSEGRVIAAWTVRRWGLDGLGMSS